MLNDKDKNYLGVACGPGCTLIRPHALGTKAGTRSYP